MFVKYHIHLTSSGKICPIQIRLRCDKHFHTIVVCFKHFKCTNSPTCSHESTYWHPLSLSNNSSGYQANEWNFSPHCVILCVVSQMVAECTRFLD